MATRFIHRFFTFPASAQTSGSEPPRVLTAKFGDGYQQRVRDGDVNRLQTWNLTFTDRSPADLKVIDDFLDSFHGVDAFVWKPPNPWGPRWFVCKDWNFDYGDGNLISGINAVFQEVIGPKMAARIIIVSGNFQTASVNALLTQPLVVQVLDSDDAPVLGFPLTWEVTAGGGHLSSVVTSTGADGKAQARFTMGPVELTNQVSVTAAGLGGSPAIFLEYAAASTDNWAGNSFDWMTPGPTSDVQTEVNVGDTSLGIIDPSRFISADGKVILQAGTDKAVILPQRTALVYPFVCPNWTDLRLGMFLSITKNEQDNDLTGMTESLVTGIGIGANAPNLAWIGFKNNSDAFPYNSGVFFAGITAVPSTLGVQNASPDSDRWYCDSYPPGSDGGYAVLGIDGGVFSGSGSNENIGRLEFPAAATVADGYAGFFVLKLTRATPTTLNCLMQVQFPHLPVSGIVDGTLFSNDPTLASIRAALRSTAFDLAFRQWGPHLSSPTVLEALYFYWPFYSSNLKIHAVVIEKFA